MNRAVKWLRENGSRRTRESVHLHSLPRPIVFAMGAASFAAALFTGIMHWHEDLYGSMTALVPLGVITACLAIVYVYSRSALRAEGNSIEEVPTAGRFDGELSQPGTPVLDFTDPLTGLGNKARLQEKFSKLAGSRFDGNFRVTLGIMDLDGLKQINDLFGFSGGDEILRQCAARLEAAVREDGIICRFASDEFGFLFPGVPDEDAAAEKGRLLQNVLLAPFDLDGHTVRLSGSFGFANGLGSGRNFDELMENAVTALSFSKRRGRGRVTVFSREIEKLSRENARLEQALRNAVANNQVEPHFQPIISLQNGKLLGFEALARWTDPELGSVSPVKFIPLAEERGIIEPLTEALLFRSARIAAEWPQGLFLSFNLSGVQLVDPSTAASIIAVINRAGLAPDRLEIEVTETAMMSDPETAAMVIDQLHRAGVRISMDDFGTGQSSLGRLRELRLDKVKIDRAFISAINEDKSAEHIVHAILELCAGLDLTVVAEGIEEFSQAESLKRYGCHAGQGYLFGRPQDERRTAKYIRNFRNTADEPKLELAHTA